jgi:hypothetical protein
MSNDFVEIQKDLNKLRATMSELSDAMSKAMGKSFDVMRYTIKNFTGYENPEDITSYIAADMPKNIAEKNLEIVENNIRILTFLTIIIEAQTDLANKKSEAEENSIDEDNSAFAQLLDNVLKTGVMAYKQLDDDNGKAQFMKSINGIIESFSSAVIGKQPFATLAGMSETQLLEKIFDLRMGVAEEILKNIKLNVDKVCIAFEASMLVRKSIDEGILPQSADAQIFISKFDQVSIQQLINTGRAAKSLHAYLARVFEMGGDNAVYDANFKPVRNTSASILKIVELIP